MTTTAPLKSYGPVQFPTHAGLDLWQFERAQRLGLIPDPDATGRRWSAAVFDDVIARIDAVKKATGTMPDVGAARAEKYLADRYSMTVHPGTAAELARRGHLPLRGEYRGRPLYCGLTLESFRGTDRRKVQRASAAGRLHMRDAAARVLGVRESDFDHLVRAGLLIPREVVEGQHHTQVRLYRQADLDRLLRSRRLDWLAIRATPKGQRSPLAALPDKKTAAMASDVRSGHTELNRAT
ncbi:hypothetical protein [Streptomyces sp. CC224B]|uniref:hypothetical protein n=1 Tax=Streptomyces sp. CC224B TaxID=3044571 RepID=UPI0024A8A289|nr:hypothetical protein [Streptomyces sp. CC224B]